MNTKAIVILHMHGKKLYNNYVFEIPVLAIDFKIKFVIVIITSREMYQCLTLNDINITQPKKLQKLHKRKNINI